MGRSKDFFFFLNFYTFRGKDENKTQISFSTNSQLGGWVDWLVTRLKLELPYYTNKELYILQLSPLKLRIKPSGSSGAMLTVLSCSGGAGCSDELPTIFWHVSIRLCLHFGHEECELSHLSMHRTWNPWLHLGRRRTRSPGANSDRHITHSASMPGRLSSVE